MIKEAVLTLRKAGKSQLEYLKITIEDGRVMALDIEAGDDERRPGTGRACQLLVQQDRGRVHAAGQDGLPQGATTFEDQWSESN